MRKIAYLCWGLTALVALPGAACAGKLTISTGMWVGYGSLYLARDLGYFKEGGLDVDLMMIDDNLSIGASLVSGAISGAEAEVDVMLPLRKTACVKGVVTLDQSAGADGILSTDDITDLSQLKGKQIAVSEPGYPNIFLSYVLQRAGLARSDVTLLNMRPDDAAAAFIAGQVPIAVTYEPNLTFVANNHKGRVLFDSSQASGLIADLVYLRCDVLEKQPQDVRTLIAGLLKADDYIEAHPDDAYDIMRKYVGGFLATRADFANAAKGVKYYDRATNATFLGTKEQPGEVMTTVDFVEKAWGTAIVQHYSYDELFDPSFAP